MTALVKWLNLIFKHNAKQITMKTWYDDCSNSKYGIVETFSLIQNIIIYIRYITRVFEFTIGVDRLHFNISQESWPVVCEKRTTTLHRRLRKSPTVLNQSTVSTAKRLALLLLSCSKRSEWKPCCWIIAQEIIRGWKVIFTNDKLRKWYERYWTYMYLVNQYRIFGILTVISKSHRYDANTWNWSLIYVP